MEAAGPEHSRQPASVIFSSAEQQQGFLIVSRCVTLEPKHSYCDDSQKPQEIKDQELSGHELCSYDFSPNWVTSLHESYNRNATQGSSYQLCLV